jgi:hypothetical protein
LLNSATSYHLFCEIIDVGYLSARLGHDDSRHLLAHSRIECQHALRVVAWLCVVDFDGNGEFVVWITGFSGGWLELRDGEIAMSNHQE